MVWMSGKRLVVDLTSVLIADEGTFWNAIAEPLRLPAWFGRNLDAWNDVLVGREISEVVDQQDLIVIRVRPEGLFAAGDTRGQSLREATDDSGRALIEVVE
jgi:hypothetical protein